MTPGRQREGVRAVSLAFIGWCIALMVNQGAHAAGLPAFTTSTATPYDPLGAAAFTFIGIPSIAAITLIARRAPIPQATWLLALATSGVFLAVYISTLLGGHGSSSSALLGALASAAALISGSVLPSGDLRKLLVWAGGIFAWGSLMVGMLTISGVNGVAGVDLGARYSEWLRFVGLPVSTPELGVLTGLGGGRQALAGTMAMLLITQLTVLKTSVPPAKLHEWLVGPLGSALALAWTFSRTGLIALLLAAAITVLPWRRWSGRPPVVLTFLGLVALSLIPLAALSTYQPGAPSGTWEWRLELWHRTLESLRTAWVFGDSPATPPPLGALHTHNLVLEVLVVGGVLALMAYGFFLWTATDLSVRSAVGQSRAALAALTVFVVLGQTEMPLAFRSPGLTQRWLLLLLVLSAAAASIARSRNLPARREAAAA